MLEQKGESLNSAKTMWCPMARIENPHGSFNRNYEGRNIEASSCITNKCMMWRWSDKDDYNLGFCGLAGAKGI